MCLLRLTVSRATDFFSLAALPFMANGSSLQAPPYGLKRRCVLSVDFSFSRLYELLAMELNFFLFCPPPYFFFKSSFVTSSGLSRTVFSQTPLVFAGFVLV